MQLGASARLVGDYLQLLSRPSRTPFKLLMGVTYECHSRCQTCNIWKIYEEEPELRGRELTLDEYRLLFQQTPDLLWLSITGGEPFLRRDLAEIVDSAASNSEGLRIVNLPTNGMHPRITVGTAKRLLESHPEIDLFVTVSLDGPERIHDNVRGFKGAWNLGIETLASLVSLAGEFERLKVSFQHTISPLNLGSYEDMISQLKDLGLSEIIADSTVTVMHYGSLYHNSGDSKAAIQQVKEEIRRISGMPSGPGPAGLLKRAYTSLLLNYLDLPRGQLLPCAALRGTCYLDPYGDLHPCIIMGDVVGNIRDTGYSLEKLLQTTDAERLRREVEAERCPSCWTPCEAYPTILMNPGRTISLMASNALGRNKGRPATGAIPLRVIDT